MDQKDFLMEEVPSTFGGTKLVLKKYLGSDPKVSVPAGVAEIGMGAFTDNLAVVEVELPESVSVISECAFAGCKNLQAINVPEGIGVIAGSAFADCESLEYLRMPGRENFHVERTAFFGCTRLEEKWKKGGLCPVCGCQLTRRLFQKVCNRCHTVIK